VNIGFAPEPVVEATIQRLKEGGFLGDKQFAQEWIENRTAFRPRSKRMLIAMELRQKGVEEEVIEQALADTEDESPGLSERHESTPAGWPGRIGRRFASGWVHI
jgi:regulatory protein